MPTFDRPQTVDLAKIGTEPPKGLVKETAKTQTAALAPRLEELLDLATAAGHNGILILFQGMDAAGKDGAIKGLLDHCHAQAVRAVPFKVPTAEEAAHDFLWRVHAKTPRRGEVALFNRSHYEDVGVVRVHGLIDKKEAERRFERIREFEALLAESGTLILKFWLHISKDEQEVRLLEREKDPKAAWKLNPADWAERERWSDYQKVFGDAIGATAAPHAPWHVIPADKKWYRNLLVAQTVIAALEPLERRWSEHLEAIGERAKVELAAYREAHPRVSASPKPAAKTLKRTDPKT